MTADLTPTTDAAPVYLNVTLALYQVAYGEDSEDQYELADRITTEITRRRSVAHPADSIPDLMRRYGEARHNAAMEGDRGTYRDSVMADVQAEEAFTRVLELLAERDATIAQLRDQLATRVRQIRYLGEALRIETRDDQCCTGVGNAWGHGPLCSNVPPFLHPDDEVKA